MAQWSELTLEAMRLVETAQGYLAARRGRTLDPVEQASMEAWAKKLDDWLLQIRKLDLDSRSVQQPAAAALHAEPTYTILAQHLDLSGQQLHQLHEWYDYQQVDSVMRTLDQHLGNFMIAGPHGPGKGPGI